MPWEFTDTWDWAAFFLAVVGFVGFLMAIQPFTQAIWGKPRIIVETGAGNLDNNHPYLEFVIVNEPIDGGLLGFLGVARDTADEIFAMINIKEYTTNREIVPRDFAKLVRRGSGVNGTQRISLPASVMGASAAVVIQGDDAIIGAVEGTPHLSTGTYLAEIGIAGLKKPVHFSAKFTIAANGKFRWG
ncbi:MAG: hypothetical protein ABID84_01215 [Chloroflexota bacterium]